MKRTLILALIALPIMLALDLTWVGVVANSYYRAELGYLYAPQTLWQAAAAFYVIYLLGLSHFVLRPGIASGSFKRTVANAAFFGLIAYSTYDLTSLAVTTDWPLAMTFVDITWGVVCAAVVSALVYLIAEKFLKPRAQKELHPMVTTDPSTH